LHEVLDLVEFLSWQEKRKHPSDVSESEPKINDQDFEALADQLADELVRSVGTNVPLLSDYAVSRTGIYDLSAM
jgi:hypothetical protein